jgi:hypothetical protein
MPLKDLFDGLDLAARRFKVAVPHRDRGQEVASGGRSRNRRAVLARYFGTKYEGSGPYFQPEPTDPGALMAEFVYGLDRAGYPVPGVGAFDYKFEEIANQAKTGIPRPRTHEVAALAQHPRAANVHARLDPSQQRRGLLRRLRDREPGQ